MILECLGRGLAEGSVVVGRRPDNVHDVWHSRLSTSKHSNTSCLRHIDVVFIGQLKLVNSFSNLALLQLLTLGAHAPEGYGSCPVCVSVCVCVSVRNLNLGTGASRGLNEGTSE